MPHERTVVLVVDDVAEQVETLRRGLHLLGLDCQVAEDAAQAHSLLQGPRGQDVTLLLADLTLPGRSGARLVAQARAVRPDLPILLVTGLMLSAELLSLRASGIPLLRKPFTHEQLGRAIQALLAPSPCG